MKLLNKLRIVHRNFWITAVVSLQTCPAWAAAPKDIGELFDQGGTVADSTVDGLLQGCGLVGLVFFIINGAKLLMEKKNQQESASNTWKGLLLGIFLMAPFTFQALVFNSTLSESKSAADIRKVISG